MLNPLGILLRTEDSNGLVVGSARGFEAFVALHAVVQTWGHAVDAKEGVLDEFGRSPFAACEGVGGFDVAVDWGGELVGRIVVGGYQCDLPSRTLNPMLSQSICTYPCQCLDTVG